MFLVKSFTLQKGLVCRGGWEPFSARYHEPVLSATYTKRKSMASKYISALRDRQAAALQQL
jgi:hypothetical protein